jgi:hypothetical protein
MSRRRHLPRHRGPRKRAPRRRRFAKAVLSTVVGLATVLVAQWAFGYWTASATGSGAVGTGSDVVLTLTVGTPSSTLFPGGTSAVALTVTNPSYAAVAIGSLLLDTSRGTAGLTVDAGHLGCDVSVLSYTAQTNSGAGWSVPPRVGTTNGTLSVSLSDALAMSQSAADACQGATFTVYLRVGP